MTDNILILTGSFGEGHKQVAQSILKAIELHQSQKNVRIVDFISWSHPALSSRISNGFALGIKTFPKLYGRLYMQTNYGSKVDSVLKKLLNFEAKKMDLLIEETEPSVILCTLPYLANIIEKMNTKKIPVVTVITDYAAHSAWVHPAVALYFVGSTHVKQQLIDLGVRAEKIKCTGIPVKPEFLKEQSRYQLALKNGLQGNIPTLLIMGGGYGMMEGNEIVQMIRDFDQTTLQIVIICGFNTKLKNYMERELNTSKHHIRILGYINNVHEYMKSADVIMTKSGGITTSEALVTALPMLLVNPIPGQERSNATFLVEQGAAVLALNSCEAKKQLDFLLLNPTYLKKMRDCERKLAIPEAAELIIFEMDKLLNKVQVSSSIN